MVATPSTMVQLGSKAHPFSLPDPISGKLFEFNKALGQRGSLIAFICNHCPYVIHILPTLLKLCNQWKDNGLNIVLISSNDVKNYPADSPELMADLAKSYGFNFPYLYDKDQSVALAYQAACTPDFFLYDSKYCLYYRGQFDDSRPGNDKVVTGHDLELAVERLLSNQSAPEIQQPSLGCNLKWIKGNEPAYFTPKK
jgi:thiol-disulfide isomerase/thioredoxin